jgi:hypothetical protein
MNRKAWENKIKSLPKLTRFWRMTTARKTHYAETHHSGNPPMSSDIPKRLLKKAWLAKLLNEHILIEHYDGDNYGGWKNVFHWPARKLPER